MNLDSFITAFVNHDAKELKLKRNECLKIAGTIDTNLYYIIRGSFRIYFYDNSDEQVVRLCYEGDIMTALDSFMKEKPSPFVIQALKQSTVLITQKSQIINRIKEDSYKEDYLKLLENLTIEQLEREVDILTTSPLERYQRVLERSPELFQRIPNKHIANYLRMTPETFSRIKKSLI